MEKITFECETITPMFLYGFDGINPELRAPSIKGALRFWWRAVRANNNIKILREEEQGLFGGLGDKTLRSAINLKVREKEVVKEEKKSLKTFYNLKYDFNRIKYTLEGREAGIGYLLFSVDKKPFIADGSRFTIEFSSNINNKDNKRALKSAIASFWCLVYLGGLGGRSRRGGGNLSIINIQDKNEILEKLEIDIDFIPKCDSSEELSEWLNENFKKVQKIICEDKKDSTIQYSNIQYLNPLISKEPKNNWKEALGEIGELYREFRFDHKNEVFETATFGLPVSHRINNKRENIFAKISSDKINRRSSPITFKVIKSNNKFYWLSFGFSGEFLKDSPKLMLADQESEKIDFNLQEKFRIKIEPYSFKPSRRIILKEFYLKNYKNIKMKENLTFKKLNILIGPNGSGKSNFLEAITFLIDLIESGFEKTISDKGYRRIIDRYSKNDKIEFMWIFKIEDNYGQHLSDLTYELEINIPERDYLSSCINKEIITYSNVKWDSLNIHFKSISCHEKEPGECYFTSQNNKKRIEFKISNRETIFKQRDILSRNDSFLKNINPHFIEMYEAIISFVKHSIHYNLSFMSVEDIKEPSKLIRDDYLINRKGDNFSNVIRCSFEKYKQLKEDFLALLDRFDIGIKDISYKEDDGEVKINVGMDGTNFSLGELSDGTVRLMLFNFIINSPESFKSLFFDEPELNVHPAWLKIVSDGLIDASKYTQIFISTHSPDLLDKFTEEFTNDEIAILVFEENREIRQQKLTEALKSSIEKGWELGDLYRVGDYSIGGWPW